MVRGRQTTMESGAGERCAIIAARTDRSPHGSDRTVVAILVGDREQLPSVEAVRIAKMTEQMKGVLVAQKA